MTLKLLPCLAVFAALAACGRGQPASSPPAPEAAPAAAPAVQTSPILYRCGNGRTLEATYADDKAIIQWGGKRHELKAAQSASGARYVGDGLQWWTKGMRDGSLSQLALGELVASDVGISCTADPNAPAQKP